MRIVVVENESQTRNGLLRMLEKYTAHQVAGTAEDGAAGLELIRRVRPDLVLSDIKMPKMDGLAMLQRLSEENLGFHTILLTGYPDFEYARKAVQLEVTSYILKPVNLTEFLGELDKVESKLEKRESSKASVGQLVYSLLTSPHQDREGLYSALREQLRLGAKDEATLFLVRPSREDNEAVNQMQALLEQALNTHYMGGLHIMRLPNSMGILAILMGTENNPAIQRRFQERILPQLKPLGEVCCCAGQLGRVEELEGLLAELNRALQYAFSFPQGTVISQEMIRSLDFAPLEYPEDLEHAIRREIRRGAADRVQELGEQFYHRVVDARGSPLQIREYVVRFASGVLGAMQEWGGAGGHDSDQAFFHQAMETVVNIQSREDLRRWFQATLDRIAPAPGVAETENTAVLKVICYIRENYSRDITLTDAAKLVGLTPEYLSKLFNQEVGFNFVAFLRDFRISVAKRLLQSRSCKIQEVAAETGFHDVKYFNKVFKSVCGVSPSEYKRGAR